MVLPASPGACPPCGRCLLAMCGCYPAAWRVLPASGGKAWISSAAMDARCASGLKRLEQALRAAGVLLPEEAGAILEGKEVKKRRISKARGKRG